MRTITVFAAGVFVFGFVFLTSTIAFAVDPVLSGIEGSAQTYNEGAAAKIVSSAVMVTDADDVIAGAVIQITGNFVSTEDILSFTSTAGITGSYDASTGVLTLSGLATPANYTTVLRSVTYRNSNGVNAINQPRTISYSINDGTGNSNMVSRNLTVINSTPVVAGLEAAAITYTEEDSAIPITSGITVTDSDNTLLSSATIVLSSSTAQDALAFTSAFGITGSYVSGTLTLTGPASPADFEAAIRSVTFINTNTLNPPTTSRTLTFRVNDGSSQSTAKSRSIIITPVDDAPILSAIESANLAYSEGGAVATITSTLNVADDDTNLTGATVQITGNLAPDDILSYVTANGITGSYDAGTGTMTLTGTTTVANYRSSLRAVKFSNSNNNDPSSLTRTLSFQVTDAFASSNIVTRDITFTAVNDKPVLSGIEAAPLSYTEEQGDTPLSSTIAISDVDNTTLASATISFSASGYNSTYDKLVFSDGSGITASFNATTGVLSLTGVAAVATYEAALRSVMYKNTNTYNPTTANRTVNIVVNDGTTASTTVSRGITFTAVNDAPVLSAMELTNVNFTAGSATPVAVTSSLTVVDDNANLSGATVQITGNYVSTEDLLTYTIPSGSGISAAFDAVTGTVTFSGSGTVANYQSTLRSLRYRNSNGTMASPLTRTISFSTNDGSLASNTTSRNVVVAAKRTVTTNEEVNVDFPVAAYAVDVNANINPSTINVLTTPADGTVSADMGTGVFTFVPVAEFTGSNTFTYTVNDVNGITSGVVTVTLTVALINDAPSFTAGPDITVNEDAGAQTVAGWATNLNDNDPFTTQTLSFTVTNDNNTIFSTQPGISSSGNLTFTPKANSYGTTIVSVTMKDNGSNTLPHVNYSDTKTFTILILPVNDAPVGNPESYSTSSNAPLTANAKTNDTDLEGNTLSLSSVALVPPAHGNVVINSNGVFVYTPDGSYTGTDSFTYEVCDDGTDNGVASSRCGQAVVTITVNPTNSRWNIVGNNSIELGPDDFILTQALNNQQGAIWNRVPLDLHYSFDLNLNAIFSAPGVSHDDGADGIAFVFQRDLTPPPLNVPDLPIYARGVNGGSLGVGGITPSMAIEVDTYMNGGEVVYDHIAMNKDGDVFNNLAAPVAALTDGSGNAMDIEDGAWHAVKITWDYPAKTFRVAFDGVDRIVYSNDIVNTVFGGDPAGVYWGFSSATGGKNNYQAVRDIVMTVVNLDPVAVTDDVVVDEDAILNGASVMTNDYDPEATAILVTPETKATAHGQVVINADGTFVYTPNADYNGTDTFTYQICDSYSPAGCSTGTVNITINPVQDAPISNPDHFTTPEDTQLVVYCNCVLHNDVDVDGETLTAIVDKPVSHGTLDFEPDGSFTYMPDKDFFGTDTFTYHATDNIDETPETLVTIIVTPVNDPPVATDDVVNVTEDTPALLPILSNDTDVDDILTPGMVSVITPPAHGTITIDSDGVNYIPDPNYYGPDSFTYTLTDAAGAVSNTAGVSITVDPVNDAPVAAADIASTPEDVPVTISILVNDSDVDNALDIQSVKVMINPAHGSTEVLPDGTIIYTPAKDYFGSDTFSYTVKDVLGLTSAAAQVSVSVTPVNDAPVSVPDLATTLENTPVEIAVLDNDFDVDNELVNSSVVIAIQPAHGTVSVNTEGAITYTPATGYLGEDSFEYTIQDPDGLISMPSPVKVTVIPPNRAPNAVDDGPITHRFLFDLTIDVMDNDFDVDDAHDELTLVSVTQPNMGAVSILDGQVIYHPEGMTSGTVTFSYTIMDPAGLTDTAIVTIEYVYNPLTVSEGFSPNNDGNNDTWYILSIENYPDNHVKIFDRWGLLVYEKDRYENTNAPWNGRANAGQMNGKLLDQGTYYYMLDVGGEIKMLSGFVMIVR